MLRFFPHQLTLDNFEKILQDNFIHICTVENYQRSIDLLAGKLGFKTVTVPTLNVNSTISKENISQIAINTFKEKYKLEYNIYEFAVNLNK